MSAILQWVTAAMRKLRRSLRQDETSACQVLSHQENVPEPQSTTASNTALIEEPASLEGVDQAVDGQVAFQNGQFVLTPPVGTGLPPVLIPDDSVILTVDGHVVSKPVALLEGMKVDVCPRRAASPTREFRIEISPDRMSAFLTLAELGPPGYRVKDAGPGHTITLVAEPLPGLQANPTVDDIVGALHEAGVTYGIDEHAIRKALAEPGRTTLRVAAGRPPVPGKPGRVESYVDKLYGRTPYGLGVEVQPGEVLARVVPPRAGKPGYDVTGQALDPAPPAEVRLIAGRGTQRSGDGTTVTAAVSGRPVVVQLAPDVFWAAVVPVANLRGPLGGSPKPYRFQGDVVVEGDVCSGVTLQAGGWIWVKGSVHGATLEAAQGIWVDEYVKGGRLITRTTRRQLVQFQYHMRELLADLEQMREYAEGIVDHPGYAELTRSRTFGEVLLLLAQQQFAQLPHRLQITRRVLSTLTVRPDSVSPEAVLNALEHTLCSGALQSVSELAQFIDTLTRMSERIIDALGAGGSDAPVHAAVLIGAEVDAEGDVVVHGSGAEQTVIRSSGSVQVNCLRDSRVEAHRFIAVETVTGSTENSPLLEVAAGGRIRIGAALIPTPLRIGNWCRTLAPDTRNVEIISDPGGEVTVVGPASRRPRNLFVQPQKA